MRYESIFILYERCYIGNVLLILVVYFSPIYWELWLLSLFVLKRAVLYFLKDGITKSSRIRSSQSQYTACNNSKRCSGKQGR